jgi:NAD(P)-dependent dehydrogenase (short-subunit alcohol dehydrogenase family)
MELDPRAILVTGSSSGIGRATVERFAARGWRVFASLRRPSSGEGAALRALAEAKGWRLTTPELDVTRDDSVSAAIGEVLGQTDGRLDVLVNNAWAGYERGMEVRFDAPFWQQPLWRWDLFAGSLRGQFVASRLAVPLMLPRKRGLIANISFTDGEVYLGQTAYDVSKSASDRMVTGMAYELRKKGISAVAIHPGFVRTERVEAAWEQLGDGPAQVVHSPEYVGRAIASLAADADVASVSGDRLAVGDLAHRYGFTDVDGRQPPAFKLEGRITLAARMERLNRVVAAGRTGSGQ